MRLRLAALAVLNSLFLAATVPAQTVHRVGPGGFATIQAAVDAAVDGDVIRIAPGTYAPFRATKSLRVVADGPGVVVETAREIVDLRLNATQRIELVGLTVRDAPFNLAGLLFAMGGTMAFEDCTFTLRTGLMLHSGTFLLRNCTVLAAAGDAVLGTGVHLSATDCSFTSTTPNGVVPTAGVRANDARLELSRCSLAGAATTAAMSTLFFAPTPALWLESSPTGRPAIAWLVDCTVQGGNSANGAVPAPAIRAANTVRTHRGTLTGGTSTTGPSAPAVEGTHLQGPLLGIGASGGLALGATFALAFAAEPNDVVGLFGTFAVQPPVAPLPFLEQPSFALTSPPGVYVGLLFADAQGNAPFALAVPNVPALQNLAVWFRGVAITQTPMQASAWVGGVVR